MTQPSDQSARLHLPFIQPSQAQKHVTHNEALQVLDTLVQLSVVELGATVPPTAPEAGAVYGLGSAPQSEWAGQGGTLAMWNGDAWSFVPPQEGFTAWDQANAAAMVYVSGAWQPQTAETLDTLGINTSADSTNRLAVAAPATLLTHDGDDHRLKVNKAAAGDTASLLFQSGFTGHAEMGLAGNTDFSVKVSADGSTWRDALRVDAATGTMSGDAVQQSATDTTPGRLMRADWGYGPGNVLGTVSQSGGVPTGAVVETSSNSNGTYTRWADGTQICTHKVLIDAIDCSSSAGALFHSGLLGSFNFPAPFASIDFASATLNGSDSSRIRNGALQARFGYFQDSTPNYWHGLVLFTTQSEIADPGEMTEFGLLAIGRWF